MDEELEFAGHPVLGAGAVLHKVAFQDHESFSISLDLSGRMVEVESEYTNGCYRVVMNQGKPEFIQTIVKEAYPQVAEALNISENDLDRSYPVEVISTGLPYLLVPVKEHLEEARIVREDFENFLSRFGAKFVYLFNPETLDCRTWDNLGKAEDAATGSAAGPLCAYLVKNRRKQKGEVIAIHQGKFVNRPSVIEGWVSSSGEVFIRGDVSFFATGEIVSIDN
jgi:PhzF family phenazine biosynthesis protein